MGSIQNNDLLGHYSSWFTEHVTTATVTPPSGAGDLFQLFRDGSARTKAELIELTGLSRTTVSARIEALLATGLIAPAGEAASSGGRPPARVAFDPSARVLIAVDLGATHGTTAVCDLAGRILASRRTETPITAGPLEVLGWATSVAQELLIEVGRQTHEIVGVGIGVPGPVEHATGRPTNPPIMAGWDRFDIPGFIAETFPVPVLVDNDVNLLALGEQHASWPHIDDLVYIKVSTGIGAGIIAGGVLQRGAQGSAGDIGHVQVPRSRDLPRDADDERDLEAIASGPAIAKWLSSQSIPAEGLEDVLSLVRSSHPVAIEATRQAGRHVGEVLATLVNLLNPTVIVIGGSVARAGEHLLAGVREVVYRRSIPLATQHLAIVPSAVDTQAGVLGAAILVTQRALSPAAVDRLVAAR